MEYFYEKDFSPLKDWLVLLDYEGTLVVPGSEEISQQTKDALTRLVAQNEVVICSNRRPIDGFEAEFGVRWPLLDRPKPHTESTLSIIGNSQKRIVVVGDNAHTDGALARALDVPFVPVATLGRPREKTKIFADDQMPAVLLPEAKESIAIVVSGKEPFFKHLASDVRNRRLLHSAEQLAHALNAMNISVAIDPVHMGGFRSAIVLGDDPNALTHALRAKKKGYIGSLVVAPYTPVLNTEQRATLQDVAIDAVLLESELVKHQLSDLDQYFMRSQVWNPGLPRAVNRRLPLSQTSECELVVLKTEEKEFKMLIDIVWRLGVSLSVVSRSATFARIKEWVQKKRKISWRLIAGAGEYRACAEEAWMSNLPTLVIAPEEHGATIPEQCGLRIDSVQQLESALPDFLESLPQYEPGAYASIHCSAESRARELMSIIRTLATS